jgi:hypothetical protein
MSTPAPNQTGADVFTEIHGQPIRWTDAAGVTHAVEGTEVQGDGRLFWLRCRKGDVPPDTALVGEGEVTCPLCISILEHHAGR